MRVRWLLLLLLCRYSSFNVTLSGESSVSLAAIESSLAMADEVPLHLQAPLATITATVTNVGSVTSDYAGWLFQVCVCVCGCCGVAVDWLCVCYCRRLMTPTSSAHAPVCFYVCMCMFPDAAKPQCDAC